MSNLSTPPCVDANSESNDLLSLRRSSWCDISCLSLLALEVLGASKRCKHGSPSIRVSLCRDSRRHRTASRRSSALGKLRALPEELGERLRYSHPIASARCVRSLSALPLGTAGLPRRERPGESRRHLSRLSSQLEAAFFLSACCLALASLPRGNSG